MRVICQSKWRIITILVLVAISTALVFSTAAVANGKKPVPVKPHVPVATPPSVEPSIPSETGMGPSCLTSVTASTSGNAWIFTCPDFVSTPEQTQGSIQIFACTQQAGTSSSQNPTADVVASFTYPPSGGSQYTVKFTCVAPSQMGFNGVDVLTPVFGTTSMNVPGITLPQTLAYVSVIGNATITKDGNTIAENQPAIALVTSAIHDQNQRLLANADPGRREIHLVVPGPKSANGAEVTGFPSGSFYLYWPSASLNMNNVGGVVQQNLVTPPPATTPATVARGPVVAGKMQIVLTNTGIVIPSGQPMSGLYDVTITNRSSSPRGLYMTGTDICCTEFNRYSKVLRKNQSQTFRFYFAPGTVDFKDMLSCERRAKTCVATYGKHTASIRFR